MEYLQSENKATSYTNTPSGESLSEFMLPLSPICRDTLEARICQKFVKHLRHVPSSRMAVKVLSSLQYTADMLGCSDAHVAKVLVDYGLRAPRAAFPETFLQHIDVSLQKEPYEMGAASYTYKELYAHWMRIGESPFMAIERAQPSFEYSFVHS